MLLAISIVLTVIPFQSIRAADSSAVPSWSSLATMPTGRGGLGIAVASGKIFAIGGSNANGELSINEMYDPVTNVWSSKSSMPTARSGFAIATYANKIYVIGGSVGDSFTGNVEVYDTLTGTWQTKASMPTPRADLTASVVNGKIFLIGGKTYSSDSPYYNQTSINQVYDIATNTWSVNASMPIALQGYASTVVDNKIYFIGGARQSTTGIDSSTTAVQIYDTATDSWTTGKSLDTPSSYGAAVLTTGVMAPTKIYYIGGYSSGTFSGKTQIYDIQQNSWSNGPDMPTARAYLGLAVVSDVVYAVGGFDGTNWLNSNEEFKPVGYGKITPQIEIISPENKTYKSIEVDYTINKGVSWVGYSLDNHENVTLTGTPEITGLTDGQHSLMIYANDTLGNMGVSKIVIFHIDNTAPNITILLPQDQTYNTADVQLTFLVDEPIVELSYSLDGQTATSITGNITLPALPDGNHRLTVNATDEMGNSGVSNVVNFSISTFPTFWVATIIAAAIILLASGYLCFKRVKPDGKASSSNISFEKKM
jgi:N-acetylneuraminic acid mutarotase